MKPLIVAAFAATAAIGLAGCSETTSETPSTAAAGAPSAADQACLAAVSRETNNGDVTVINSQFSEAGTQVTVGVGPQRAPWNCIAYSDGTTAGIESLTNEGTL